MKELPSRKSSFSPSSYSKRVGVLCPDMAINATLKESGATIQSVRKRSHYIRFVDHSQLLNPAFLLQPPKRAEEFNIPNPGGRSKRDTFYWGHPLLAGKECSQGSSETVACHSNAEAFVCFRQGTQMIEEFVKLGPSAG
jgi:hypothetical protein